MLVTNFLVTECLLVTESRKFCRQHQKVVDIFVKNIFHMLVCSNQDHVSRSNLVSPILSNKYFRRSSDENRDFNLLEKRNDYLEDFYPCLCLGNLYCHIFSRSFLSF